MPPDTARPRPGTPAAQMPDQVPPDVVAERYQRLVELTERVALAQNQALVGRTVEVLLGQAQGRKDAETDRVSGRAADNRLVHLRLPDQAHATSADAAGADSAGADATRADADRPRPGDLVRVRVTHAAPHHLVADSGAVGGLFEVRRTRAGDAWAGLVGSGGSGHAHPPAGGAPVSLGLPLVRA
jgi:tRNA-2-methylthio-N6-dimethylallyladenosine synthase